MNTPRFFTAVAFTVAVSSAYAQPVDEESGTNRGTNTDEKTVQVLLYSVTASAEELKERGQMSEAMYARLATEDGLGPVEFKYYRNYTAAEVADLADKAEQD